MRRAAWLVLITASCARAAAPSRPEPPKPRAEPTVDAGTDADKPTCVKPPPDYLCEWPPECKRFGEQMDGPDGKGFWAGFNTVCSCTKVAEKEITAELVVRELGKDWSVVMAECPGHMEPTSFLRSSTGQAMPLLSEREARVRPIDGYFTPYLAALREGGQTGNDAFARHQRKLLASLRGARWVRFARVMPDGGTDDVTDFVVGFLPSGHLAGFYADGQRW